MASSLFERCHFNLIKLDRERKDRILELAIGGLLVISNDSWGKDPRDVADLILLRMEEEAEKLDEEKRQKDRDDRLRAEQGIFG